MSFKMCQTPKLIFMYFLTNCNTDLKLIGKYLLYNSNNLLIIVLTVLFVPTYYYHTDNNNQFKWS